MCSEVVLRHANILLSLFTFFVQLTVAQQGSLSNEGVFQVFQYIEHGFLLKLKILLTSQKAENINTYMERKTNVACF